MKVSTKGRYGLRILLDLALHERRDEPRLIREIAASQKISEKYVGRLLITLRRAGLVVSIRGARGGFRLGKKPEEITLLDVVEATEGPTSIVACAARPEICKRSGDCGSREIWLGVNREVRDAFRRVTLRDVVDKSRIGGGLVEIRPINDSASDDGVRTSAIACPPKSSRDCVDAP